MIKSKEIKTGFVLLIFVFLASICLAQDVEGSEDHPLFNRIEGFYITYYNVDEFGSEYFLHKVGSSAEEIQVDGKKTEIKYETNTPTSPYKITKNYMNAIEKIGGTAYKYTQNKAYLHLDKKGKEVWVAISTSDTWYYLTIIESASVEQQIVADPKAMADDINTTGHVTVYGIYFDVNSFTIKPESAPTLKAISEIFKMKSKINLYVIGHTDMTGDLKHNMELSENRAKAVVDALVKDYGISAKRLTGKGVGPLCPVSTNKTVEGKQLNRRVELVER
jgi:outer membrane protein OmpA-like peptidoglycan-associated protein